MASPEGRIFDKLGLKDVHYTICSGFDFKVGKIPQRLTFIYVKDLAKAVFLALENKKIAH